MTRRTFLGAASTLGAQTSSFPVIDTHIHLFDPSRPQGVPWPPKDGRVPYRPTLPRHLRQVAQPHGVVGAIEVECSPWLEDNQWVLDVAAGDPMMVGMVGNLDAGKPDFRKHLDRFGRNPLFLGIRYGYLWGRNLAEERKKAEFVSNLRALADAGRELDTVGPPAVLTDVLRITDQVPNLRVVIDHLPRQEPPRDPAGRSAYEASLRELAQRPQVFVKVSEVLRQAGGEVPQDLDFYRPRLDMIWGIFGPDRLLFGSDWPNSEPFGPYTQVLAIVRGYFGEKGHEASEKFFWKNSVAAYRWVKRAAGQPGRA